VAVKNFGLGSNGWSKPTNNADCKKLIAGVGRAALETRVIALSSQSSLTDVVAIFIEKLRT
jgi:hypothetical protein